MKDNSDVVFLITAYDQIREVKFTIHMLRNLWKTTSKSPIVLVISGDYDRTINFNDDPFTRVVHLDDMVGDKFKILVSTSIMRQIEHGMIEVRDLEREHGTINSIVHMHGDILLLGEDGFFQELERWRSSDKPIGADPVSANGPFHLDLFDKQYRLSFYGQELMPQLFAVNHAFCKATSYMYSMPIIGDLEEKATEWALIGNLHRACGDPPYFSKGINSWDSKLGPYIEVFDEEVYIVKKGRQQWGLHTHWGGFCHFGNSLHYTKAHREQRNEAALRQYGLDLSEW